MKDKQQELDNTVFNVVFRDAVFLGGLASTATNFRQGYHNGTATEVSGGIFIDIPGRGEICRFATKVPYSNIKQIEYTPRAIS